jgi:two-component system heavy metal sensor histidine kinase CusS
VDERLHKITTWRSRPGLRGKLFEHINYASLRFRLALWYVGFTFLCMSIYGAVLSQYLKYELRSSRDQTMLRREQRFVSFIDTDAQQYPAMSVTQQIVHFAQASPETDVIEVLDLTGRRLYPGHDPGLPWIGVPGPHTACSELCLTSYVRDGHHWHLLMHRTTLAGKPVWLLMSGLFNEHYDILRSVRTGYFGLLPLVLLGSMTGGYALSRRALVPVGRLTETARSISLQSLNARLPVPSTGDELQSLAEAWNDLLVRLEAEVDRSTRLTLDVSHDLRSAMTVILANAQLSLRRSRSPEQYRDTLASIQQESIHVLAMLEDMLLAARTTEAEQQIEKTLVCFSEIVAETFEASKAAAAMKNQEFSLTGTQDPEQEIWLQGNRSLLRRLVGILVDNALKYTPHGGLVALSLDRSGPTAVFSVSDTGVGIPPHLQGRVFDRFFRADSARSRRETPGAGLGLSIAKWIADVHGFQLQLESVVGRGSRFSVTLGNTFPEVTTWHDKTSFSTDPTLFFSLISPGRRIS